MIYITLTSSLLSGEGLGPHNSLSNIKRIGLSTDQSPDGSKFFPFRVDPVSEETLVCRTANFK